VIGENVNIGAGTIVANLKHSDANVESKVNGKILDTGRRKLGTIIGDGAKIGIGTRIYPGRKIWPNVFTMPSENVKKDKMK
jgi:bifunctional UDP-N-acetylglucosamine pyrophosphorylase/glucosamine-1-phosphate N-acetyltransferase